jgi:DNA uptake protein ComE-like DNA-binding protein
MVQTATVALALVIATAVASGVSKISMSKTVEKTELVEPAPKKVAVAKARVVYAGYGSEIAASKIVETAPTALPSSFMTDPVVIKPANRAEKVSAKGFAPIDLNAAAVHELNAAGGGMIGRAIIKGRPYNSVEELLTKRVVNRATFDIIKQRITVRI